MQVVKCIRAALCASKLIVLSANMSPFSADKTHYTMQRIHWSHLPGAFNFITVLFKLHSALIVWFVFVTLPDFQTVHLNK